MAEHAKALVGKEGMTNQSSALSDFLWKNHSELRRELLESQKIRAQIIGFKITFLGTAIGIILAKLDQSQYPLLVIPAFAAIFFDLLIQSYSFSAKRIGLYCHDHIEPLIVERLALPGSVLTWEQFVRKRQQKQWLAMAGNLGITVLSIVPAVLVLLDSASIRNFCLLAALALFLGFDIYVFRYVFAYGRTDD